MSTDNENAVNVYNENGRVVFIQQEKTENPDSKRKRAASYIDDVQGRHQCRTKRRAGIMHSAAQLKLTTKDGIYVELHHSENSKVKVLCTSPLVLLQKSAASNPNLLTPPLANPQEIFNTPPPSNQQDIFSLIAISELTVSTTTSEPTVSTTTTQPTVPTTTTTQPTVPPTTTQPTLTTTTTQLNKRTLPTFLLPVNTKEIRQSYQHQL